MRPWLFRLCLSLCVIASSSARSQSTTPSAFQEKAQAAVTGGKSIQSIKLDGAAEWIAGSSHASGTAELKTSTDGSASIQLNLGQSSRTEVQTKVDASRACQWTDASGTSHEVLGANCFIAIPWFTPSLFTQPASQLSTLIASTDDGEVSKNGSAFHQISYALNLETPDTASTKQLVDQSRVKVLYDPQTFLPSSLEYAIHPDDDDLQSIEVKVLFSDYRSISGVMLPYHIEKFVNRSLQIKLDINNASIE